MAQIRHLAVVDATAAAQLPEGDGYGAGLVNFRFLSNAAWTTNDVVQMLAATIFSVTSLAL